MERRWDGKLPYISDIWKQLASMFIQIKGIEELMLKELKFKKWSASMMADLGGVVTPPTCHLRKYKRMDAVLLNTLILANSIFLYILHNNLYLTKGCTFHTPCHSNTLVSSFPKLKLLNSIDVNATLNPGISVHFTK